MRKQSKALSTRTNNVTAENVTLRDFVSRAERHIEKMSRCRHCGEGFEANLEVNARCNGFIVKVWLLVDDEVTAGDMDSSE